MYPRDVGEHSVEVASGQLLNLIQGDEQATAVLCGALAGQRLHETQALRRRQTLADALAEGAEQGLALAAELRLQQLDELLRAALLRSVVELNQ